ncbi:AMP-binding protein [Microbacterium sp. RD1]|uniref:AMP-binding protein n=1 Tax=Microbacterium sp. RD1 TaxID=3457313 RepID=UPI003FA58BC9
MTTAEAVFAPARVRVTALPGGGREVVSLVEPTPPPPSTLHWLRAAARSTPAAPVLTWCAADGLRRTLTYGEAWHDVQTLAGGLRALGHRRGDRVVILARNGPGHFLLAHAAMLAGMIWAPVAAQYAAPGADPARLRGVLDALEPALVYLDDRAESPGAPDDATALVGDDGLARVRATATGTAPTLAEISPDDPAKVLLTSGSTGVPKAVIQTHGAIAANVQATLDVWPFFLREPPVLVDWLPWNHSFGGNSNLNLVLAGGGVLHVDEARGLPGALGTTIANIIRFRPTYYAAVPAVFADMLPHLERDERFRSALFQRAQALFSAGAAMSADTFERLRAASLTVRDTPIPVLSGWGSTEVGPGATIVHTRSSRPGWIGEPLPGVTVRMVPVGEKLELRVKGHSVTPGYWGDPARTREIFDDDGFYRSGDAGVLVDENRPERGFRFDGRIAEDFKLANGSWVNTQRLRGEILAAGGGTVRDVVIAGPDRPHLIALVWTADDAEVDLDALVARHAEGRRGQTNVLRGAVTLGEPDPEELSPKGQLRPNVVLARRAEMLDDAYTRMEYAR